MTFQTGRFQLIFAFVRESSIVMPISAMRRICCVALLLAAGLPASAQDVQRIAAIVNDDVISVRDVERRIDLMISATGQPNSPDNRRRAGERAIRSLIDERLQMQEVARRNVRVSDEEVQGAFEFLAKQNNVTPERFTEMLRSSGISKDSLEVQLRAEISWNRLIRSRIVPTINVSDEEVNAAVQRIKDSAGQNEDLVAEIFLGVDTPDQEEEVRRTAQRLVEQIRGGIAFASIARQFSQGATAASGGEIGWIQSGSLPEEVDAALGKLGRGEVSDPIRTTGGFYIVRLADRRRIATSDASDARVTLKQIELPLPPRDGPERRSQIELAQTISATLSGCDDVEAMAKELKSPESGTLGTMRISDLPADFRSAVLPLKAGQVSAPIVAEKAVHVVAVCERTDPPAGGVNVDQVRSSILARRADMLARRYLRDLRRDATVELR